MVILFDICHLVLCSTCLRCGVFAYRVRQNSLTSCPLVSAPLSHFILPYRQERIATTLTTGHNSFPNNLEVADLITLQVVLSSTKLLVNRSFPPFQARSRVVLSSVNLLTNRSFPHRFKARVTRPFFPGQAVAATAQLFIPSISDSFSPQQLIFLPFVGLAISSPVSRWSFLPPLVDSCSFHL